MSAGILELNGNGTVSVQRNYRSMTRRGPAPAWLGAVEPSVRSCTEKSWSDAGASFSYVAGNTEKIAINLRNVHLCVVGCGVPLRPWLRCPEVCDPRRRDAVVERHRQLVETGEAAQPPDLAMLARARRAPRV